MAIPTKCRKRWSYRKSISKSTPRSTPFRSLAPITTPSCQLSSKSNKTSWTYRRKNRWLWTPEAHIRGTMITNLTTFKKGTAASWIQRTTTSTMRSSESATFLPFTIINRITNLARVQNIICLRTWITVRTYLRIKCSIWRRKRAMQSNQQVQIWDRNRFQDQSRQIRSSFKQTITKIMTTDL